jgi:predicted  nucleic acid-binding Zn-ribbon protein
MKFHVNEIRLWLAGDKPIRSLKFLNNKVNVITGISGTGKTSIMTIIDYCLLGSESKLVEEVINENVLWYGLSFTINEKNYFIARGKMIKQVPSKEIYFSSTGLIPDIPKPTIEKDDLRKILEEEFNIDRNLVVPYGGNVIRAGSKVSFRYFLLFITQSSNIIINPNVFFDYDLYDSEKYKEALDRIFDLSIGVDSVQNILIKEKLGQLEKDIAKLEKKRNAIDKELNVFSQRIQQLVVEAQEFDLIEKRILKTDEAVKRLSLLVQEFKEDKINTDLSEIEDLYRKRRDLARGIRNLKSFENEVEKYQSTLKADAESLAPIEYINKNLKELIAIPELRTFLESLEVELISIKDTIKLQKPFSAKVSDDVSTKEAELLEINQRIAAYPIETKEFKSSVSKFIFIGELKAKLSFYNREWENEDFGEAILKLQEEYDELETQVQDSEERREILLQLLLDRIQRFVSESTAIGSYNTFRAYINHKKKILQLREPQSVSPSNIGSSSNHMFLHLFFFLGLHEHFMRERIRYIPQFLIIDQLSQPYYEAAKKTGKQEIEDNDDRSKLTQAFGLLNDFVQMIQTELKEDFQIILLEHAPKEYWEQNDFKAFHLVDEFRDGNALINLSS